MKEWQCALCDSTLAGKLVRRSLVDRSICLWCEGELARTGRKRCRTCNVPQPLEMFHRKPDSSDGRDGRCRTCRALADVKHHVAYYAAHKDALLVASRERHARNKAAGKVKKRVRPLEQVRAYERRPERRARKLLLIKAWQARNPDKQREYNAAARERRKLKAIRAMRGQV